MADTTLVLKPVHGTATISSDFGTDAAADDYVIKLTDISTQHATVFEDVTGDGDEDPAFEHNSLLYHTFQQRGFVVGGTAPRIGIAKMIDERVTSLPPYKITAKQGENYLIFNDARCWIETIQVRWNYRASAIVVTMTGRVSDVGTSDLLDSEVTDTIDTNPAAP